MRLQEPRSSTYLATHGYQGRSPWGLPASLEPGQVTAKATSVQVGASDMHKLHSPFRCVQTTAAREKGEAVMGPSMPAPGAA